MLYLVTVKKTIINTTINQSVSSQDTHLVDAVDETEATLKLDSYYSLLYLSPTEYTLEILSISPTIS